MPSILLIEDHQGTRETSAILLRAAGFHVSTAPDGGTGLLAAQVEAFDVIVVDIGLPDMSGIDVVQHLVADGNPCVKVVTTAFPSEHAREKALSAGAAWFVEGVLLNDELEAILNTALIERAGSSLGKNQAAKLISHERIQPPLLDRRIAMSVRAAAACSGGPSLASMANTAELSVSRFRHVFTKCANLPVSKYVANLRLLIAARLLIQSDIRVVDIASRLGLSDIRYFRHVFRLRFGMSPAHYRSPQTVAFLRCRREDENPTSTGPCRDFVNR